MSGLSFSWLISKDGNALFQSDEVVGSATDRASLFYFVWGVQGTDPLPSIPDISTCFDLESAVVDGAFVFLENTPPAASALIDELARNLHHDSAAAHTRLAWRHGEDSFDMIQTGKASALYEAAEVPFGRWWVTMDKTSTIQPADDGVSLRILPGGTGLRVKVVTDAGPQVSGTAMDEIALPMIGSHAGGLLFPWQWEHGALQEQFGGEQRMFFGDDPAQAEMIRYPLFRAPTAPGPFPVNDLAFNVTAHPGAPLSGDRTRLALAQDVTGGAVKKLEPLLMRTPTGSQVALQPLPDGDLNGAGFGFGKTSSKNGVDLYMTPVGEFSVEKVDHDIVPIMAGVSGSEFVISDVGDILSFKNNKPAFAKGYADDAKGMFDLDDALCTSWVKVTKAVDHEQDASKVPTSYCSQPSTATYFGQKSDQTAEDYLIAVGISLSQLGNEADGTLPVFPFVPYGGIYQDLYNDEPDEGVNNADTAAQKVGRFERQVIEPARRKMIEPTFDYTYGPIFFDMSLAEPFNGGSARTPMGFVADLNTTTAELGAPAGSVQYLRMAQSPQDAEQFLEMTPNSDHGVVNPTFMNAALRDNLFMVVTDPQLLWPDNAHEGRKVQLGDFTFEVNVGPYVAPKPGDDDTTDNDLNQPKALVAFKYIPGISFVEMIKDPDQWTSFFAPGDDSAKVKAQVERYIQDAEADTTGLYDNFLQIINDCNWSGMLVFNCPLDYKALPPHLQILLGGIYGTLRAHHFGVTINQVENGTVVGGVAAMMKIANSSLFAVIDYNRDLDVPTSYPAFQVLNLNVEYANSKLVVFKSTIAFSIDTLFGNPAYLSVPGELDVQDSGTIEIKGVYTLNKDGTGNLVFATHEARVFTFPTEESELRALQAQSIENASLVAVTSLKQDDGRTIATAAFQLDGTLAFDPSIAKDVFSYGVIGDDGVPTAGLSVLSYNFHIVTDIPAEEGPAKITGITTELDGMKVDQAASTSRANSFEQRFPSRISSLCHIPGGQGTSQSGQWQVISKGLDKDLAPEYCMGLRIPMGNLGGLVSETNNVTADIYFGWTPGGTKGAADKVAGVLALPPVVAGPDGFNIQGIISAGFESVHLDWVDFDTENGAFEMRFQHYSGQLLNFPLIVSNSPKDLGVFGAPEDPGGDNSVWFVGKSADTDDWDNGPKLNIDLLGGLPDLFIGRSFAIKSDFSNPKVLDKTIETVTKYGDLTVAEYMKRMFAQSDLYNSAAGMTFALKLDFAPIKLSVLMHDNDFYGAKFAIDLKKKKKKKDDEDNPDGEDAGEDAVEDDPEPEKDEDKDGTKKLDGFEFMIMYRKISDHLGVWSATIFLDISNMKLGSAELSLPDFGISIWTNGDWRLDVGWPLKDHPITVKFPINPALTAVGKLGFYLAKLSSESVPAKFSIPSNPPSAPLEYPPNFQLIWAFGLGISIGVEKKWPPKGKKAIYKASASLSAIFVVEGFLASFKGDMTDNGVDYHWVCLSLSVVGEIKGEVDFKIISAKLSVSLTLRVAVAFESYHNTHLVIDASVSVKASVKIVFVTISFSFETTFELLDKTFGDYEYSADLKGPSPKEVADLFPKELEDQSPMPLMANMMGAFDTTRVAAMDRVRGTMDALDDNGAGPEPMMAAMVMESDEMPQMAYSLNAGEPITLGFLLQSTAVNDSGAWSPRGIATLVINSKDAASDFGRMCKGTADWLLDEYSSPSDPFETRLLDVQDALEDGEMDGRVTDMLAQKFVFDVQPFTVKDDPNPPPVAIFPAHPGMGVHYQDTTFPFDAITVDAAYEDQVVAYFENADPASLTAVQGGSETVTGLMFDQYFLMLAKQLIVDMIASEKDNTDDAVGASVSNVSGFVSRYLMCGLRLPNPSKMDQLLGVYQLTNQQFPLHDDLQALLVPSGDLPGWITVSDAGVPATLETAQVYTTGPSVDHWNVTPTNPLSPVPARFPMNSSLDWTTLDGTHNTIFNFPDSLHLAIEEWRADNAALPPAERDENSLWMSLAQVGGKSAATQTSTPYSATGALVMSIKLRTIAKPGGRVGEILPDIFSLVGSDEVDRAYLQELLDDQDATITGVELATAKAKGVFTSTKVPSVLVRTNLSTSTAPGGLSVASSAVDSAAADTPDRFCANYAKLPEGGDELGRFLRLVWECSIVHTGGFYLQVADIDPETFVNGEATFQLIIQTDSAAEVIHAKPYHNALIGPEPDENHAVMSTLKSKTDDVLTSVHTYTASYPGGFTGWSIVWKAPPNEPDAATDPTGTLKWLYQMVSYRVTGVGGVPVSSNWSRPIVGLNDADAWNYQEAFATAPLVGDANRYGAIGRDVSFDVSIEDIFGNSLPVQANPLPVVYNDDILDLAHWASTQNNYTIVANPENGTPQLNLNFTYGTVLLSLSDLAQVRGLIVALQDATNPVSAFLWAQFSDAAKTVMTDPEAELTQVQTVLLEGLNATLSGPSIYDTARFADVALSAQTERLVGTPQVGLMQTFTNRLLIEDAYPTEIVLQISDDSDTSAIKAVLSEYAKIFDQISAEAVSIAVNTANLLAPDTPDAGPAPAGALGGPQDKADILTYLGTVLGWVRWLDGGKAGQAPDMPEPMTLSFDLKKEYPTSWTGDMRELQVDLMIRRAGVQPEIVALAPRVQCARSPISPVQGKSTEADPSGLSSFAVGFEASYFDFDDAQGVIKVATGVNSDLTSSRLGKQSLWLARWGNTSGISVEVLNDDDNPPIYYATPPLSTQLISRTVDKVWDYRQDPPKQIEVNFSNIDIDLWAADFLSSVEGIFAPEMAPNVADNSTRAAGDASIYDPFVESKTNLARAIADRLTFIYESMLKQYLNDDGENQSDLSIAVETMRQALLNTLENDYGVAALIQMAVQVKLNGDIEPGASVPPNIFGNIMARDAEGGAQGADAKPLPYSFSAAKIPLKDGKTWLNFLLSVEDPSAQKALKLDLDFQMSAVEHNIDTEAERCGYTPSNWLSFVLQQDDPDLRPAGEENTLTAPMGAPRIPIPLRSYPPLPKLIGATATQDVKPDEIKTIAQALTWTYGLTVQRQVAQQDTMDLTITFNEIAVDDDADDNLLGAGQGRPGDLFDALARYTYEYPLLADDINALTQDGSPKSLEALKNFRDIAADVAAAWPTWVPPKPVSRDGQGDDQKGDDTHEVWNYRIDQNTDGSLEFRTSLSVGIARSMTQAPLPVIEDYQYPPIQKSIEGEPYWLYTLKSGAEAPVQIAMTWSNLYVLSYQSAHASAFIERNSNLGTDVGEKTNPAFVYRTETVSMPTAIVPLIKVTSSLPEATGASLQGAVQSMMDAMRVAPASAVGAKDPAELRVEGPISYSFRLMANGGSEVTSYLPLYLLQANVPSTDTDASEAARRAAANMNKWLTATKPKIDHSAVSFRLAVFATKIVEGMEKLPLIQFQDISVAVPQDDLDWWVPK
ncbi:hypothetical protein L0664_04960 [Octadecabacter sp. G9-8]|uniref:LysM domain-containing protein n=1 Tax=Octadecabacter dasysiphoniae TaxID=2909341 RepID=A0ABS9CT52_9RHOB|nr:hypothetical protein [Octadecabacter dasysiphoniae]MCF2870409.1 hypothetical protein [Octadecabacter dasysiphoniae]